MTFSNIQYHISCQSYLPFRKGAISGEPCIYKWVVQAKPEMGLEKDLKYKLGASIVPHWKGLLFYFPFMSITGRSHLYHGLYAYLKRGHFCYP